MTDSCLVWFQLYDVGTGLPFKEATVDAVILPKSSLIVQFRDAVKIKNPINLSHVDANDLLVYKDKSSFDKRNLEDGREVPLKSSCSLNDLGKTEEAIVVAVPSTDQVTGSPTPVSSNRAIKRFNELAGVTLSEAEEDVLVRDFPNYLRLLKRGRLNEDGAKVLLRLIKTTLKSQTLQAVRIQHQYVFGKTIDASGGKAILQKVYSFKRGGFACAKVFLNRGLSVDSDFAVREYYMSQKIGSHENIAPIEDTIEFCHETGSKEPLKALIMPLYQGSLHDLLVSLKEAPLQFNVFIEVAHGVLAAGAHFQSYSLAHGDIKPSNIMLDGFKPILIDFGAVVKLGERVREHTPVYALDASIDCVTTEYDLFCIVTTLVSCFAPRFQLEHRTKQQMISYIREVCSDRTFEEYGKVCLALLDCTSSMEALDRIRK